MPAASLQWWWLICMSLSLADKTWWIGQGSLHPQNLGSASFTDSQGLCGASWWVKEGSNAILDVPVCCQCLEREWCIMGKVKYIACISAPIPSPVAADVENHRSQSMPQLSLAIFLKMSSPFKIKSETLCKIEPRKEKSTHVKSSDFRHDWRPRRIRADWFVSGKWVHHSSHTHGLFGYEATNVSPVLVYFIFNLILRPWVCI